MGNFQNLSADERFLKLFELLYEVREYQKDIKRNVNEIYSNLLSINGTVNECYKEDPAETSLDSRKIEDIPKFKCAVEESNTQKIKIEIIPCENKNYQHFRKHPKNSKTKKANIHKKTKKKSKNNNNQNKTKPNYCNEVRDLVVEKESIYTMMRESRQLKKCEYNQWTRRKKKYRLCFSTNDNPWNRKFGI